MNNFCVYSYTDPRERLPFYIGKGLPNRPYRHLNDSARYQWHTHFYNKLNKMIDIEFIAPIIKIIVSGLSNEDACDVEKHLIAQYGRKDIETGCLCNHTDGGERDYGYEHSIDTRIKMSKPKSETGRLNIKAAHQKYATPIESYSLITGLTVKKYAAQRDVKLDGYNQGNVAHAISGKNKSSGGYGWRYSPCP